MKKQVLFFLALTVAVLTTYSQTIVFEDNFEAHETGTPMGELEWIVWEGGALIAEGEAHAGSKYVLCQPSANNFYLRKPITLEVGKTYKYEVATKSPNSFNHRPQVRAGTRTIQGVLANNDNWVVKEIEFTVEEGEAEVVLIVYSFPIQPVHVDAVKLTEVGDPTSVNLLEPSEVLIINGSFPGEFVIKSPQSLSSCNVYNIAGQKVKSVNLAPDADNRINLSGNPAGIYIFHIEDSNGSEQSIKVINK
jgi:hypothetical protein